MYMHTGLQIEDDKIQPLSSIADGDSPEEPAGPVWTTYADSYFEGDFAAPFSDLEEDGEGETTSSGSSESASLENNPSVCENQPPLMIETTAGGVVHPENGSKSTFGSQKLLSKSVDSESPLSVSSADSPEHTDPSSKGSQAERSAYTNVHIL